QGGRDVAFPDRKPPQVASYSLKKTYGDLLNQLEEAFDSEKPLLRLGIYYPLYYYQRDGEEIVPFDEGRQRQIVGLIRTLLLKRFESSAVSFRSSCEDLLLKLLYFVELHIPRTAQRWK